MFFLSCGKFTLSSTVEVAKQNVVKNVVRYVLSVRILPANFMVEIVQELVVKSHFGI